MDDAPAIAAIYNQGILERVATFEIGPRSTADIAQRILEIPRYPLLVAVDHLGMVIGWAGVSCYRPRECYSGIGEFSVYLAAHARGRRGGTQLLRALIAAAQACGYWKLISRIFLFNSASRALCRSAGFREVGIYEKHAQLDGRWLDVVIVERLIGDNIDAT